MDKKKHLICRKGAAGAMTAASAGAEARLIQPAPVRRYRVGAVGSPPFLLADKAPAADGR